MNKFYFLNFFGCEGHNIQWEPKNSGIGRRLLDSSYNFLQPNTHETQTF